MTAAIDAADVARLGRDLLVHARGLTRRHSLSRGCFARLPNGDFASWRSPRACSFCTMGFMLRAARDLWGLEDWGYDDRSIHPYPASDTLYRQVFLTAAGAVQEVLSETAGHRSIVFFNDDPSVTLQDVDALLGVAAARVGVPAAVRPARVPSGAGAWAPA